MFPSIKSSQKTRDIRGELLKYVYLRFCTFRITLTFTVDIGCTYDIMLGLDKHKKGGYA